MNINRIIHIWPHNLQLIRLSHVDYERDKNMSYDLIFKFTCNNDTVIQVMHHDFVTPLRCKLRCSPHELQNVPLTYRYICLKLKHDKLLKHFN